MKQSKDKSALASFDSLYHGVLLRLFKSIEDSRADNSSYELLDALKCGFAIYSLKFASLFSFRKRSKAEDSNLGSVYGIQNIRTDNTLRNILDVVSPDKVRKGFHDLFKRLGKIGVLESYRYWRKHLVVSKRSCNFTAI